MLFCHILLRGAFPVTKVTYPEGSTEYTYDNAFRMLSIVNKKPDSTVISGYAYTYDLVGNQIKRDDTQDGGEWYTVNIHMMLPED